MSIPRYSPNPLWFAIPIVDDKDGKLCEYRDYLKLEAENERLSAEFERLRNYVEMMERESMSDEYDLNNQSRIINGLLRDKEHLKAEVERLRKAGDEMAAMIKYEPGVNTFDPVPQVVKKWNAAKEGKQS